LILRRTRGLVRRRHPFISALVSQTTPIGGFTQKKTKVFYKNIGKMKKNLRRAIDFSMGYGILSSIVDELYPPWIQYLIRF